MLDPRIGSILRRATQLLGGPGLAATDAMLLERFIRDRDAAAFSELVTRHGAAVWSVCRRVTRSEADAEDVFQATFLVLARDARRVRVAASIGSFLYGVAVRLAGKLRAGQSRAPDISRLTLPSAEPDPLASLSWAEVRAALDEELSRLPDRLRAPLLLCYFQGLTQEEAAVELGWKPRTVKARIKRGRDLLRFRLGRRGIDLSAAFAVPLLGQSSATGVPTQLTLAVLNAIGRPPSVPAVSPVALALARTEFHAMMLPRIVVFAVASAGMLTAGSLLGRLDSFPRQPETGVAAASKSQPPARAEEPEELLPRGAIARIGNNQVLQAGWHQKAFFSADGKTLVVTGDGGHGVCFWDIEAMKLVHQMTLPGSNQIAAFSAEANLLAVVGIHFPNGDDRPAEAALWLIDTTSYKVLRTIPQPGNLGSNRQNVRISADGKRVVVEYEGRVRIIDARSGDELIQHKVRINGGALAVSSDGKLIAFGRHDLFLWRWDTGEELKKFKTIGGGGVDLMELAPNSKTLVAAARGTTLLTAWEVASGRQVVSKVLGIPIGAVSYSPDGKTLAVASIETTKAVEGGHSILLIDLMTGAVLRRLPVGHVPALDVCWSRDGSRLAALSSSRVWVWDVATGRNLGPSPTGHEANIGSLAFAPDGTLFTASIDHTIQSWNASTGKHGLVLEHASHVKGLAISPDGSLVAGSALRDDLRIWDSKSGRLRYKLLGNGEIGGRRVVRFTADGKRLVAWGDDDFVRVWEVRNGKLLAENSTRPPGEKIDLDDPFGESSPQRMMAMLDTGDISMGGGLLAIGSGKSIRILDTITGKEKQKLDVGPDRVSKLAFSPDGKRLLLAFMGKQIITKFEDGKSRGSTADDYPVSVCDLATGKPLWTSTAQGSWPGVAYSPDGKRVAVVSNIYQKPSWVRVWEADTGKEAGRFELTARGMHLAFDQSGKRLAVAFDDTTAMVFDLEAALKPATAK